MIRCFLSHSSADKKNYVDIVARILEKKLGKDSVVYDELSFETGEKVLDEILRGLASSDLFVLFLSKNSLQSRWVKKEIQEAKNLYENGDLKKLYPIIIDKDITHENPLIPKWLRRDFNLKSLSRPTVAARRIQQRLLEISWNIHSILRDKQNLFIGRNDIIEKFEQRIDNYEKNKPICVIVSGIREVGRKSCFLECLKKTSLIKDSYFPSIINLNHEESIEDFIVKIFDFGFSNQELPTNLLEMPFDDKICLATSLLKDVHSTDEKIIINDFGAIVKSDNILAEWFETILHKLRELNTITIGVISRYRLKTYEYLRKDYVYPVEVPELNYDERERLLSRLLKIEKISISLEDFKIFLHLQSGLPNQVKFTVDLIKHEGEKKAKELSTMIVAYNKERASLELQKYSADNDAIQLLALLSKFDFVSLEILKDILQPAKVYFPIIDTFLAESILERLGSSGEYLRVNDIIRDYITRGRFQISDSMKENLDKHLVDFLSTYKEEDKDIADTSFFIKEAMKQGEQIDENFLIPSHFLKTIKELYDTQKDYKTVIILANRVLAQRYTLDSNIKEKIRYYLCLSLARQRNKKCLEEVQLVQGIEHDFILGFYYRQLRRYPDAIRKFLAVLKENKHHYRSKHQLVQIFLNTEEYDKAERLAKDLYIDNALNPFNAYAYFTSMIMQPAKVVDKSIFKDILEKLAANLSDRSQEMYLSARALYLAFIENNQTDAISVINEAVDLFQNIIYPRINKFKICHHFNMKECMQTVIAEMEREISTENSHFYFSLISSKCYYLSSIGKIDEAYILIDTSLKSFGEDAREHLKVKISQHM